MQNWKRMAKWFFITVVFGLVLICLISLAGCGGKITWINPLGFKDPNQAQEVIQTGTAIGQGLVTTGATIGSTALIVIGTIIGGGLTIIGTIFGLKKKKE